MSCACFISIPLILTYLSDGVSLKFISYLIMPIEMFVIKEEEEEEEKQHQTKSSIRLACVIDF